MRRLKAKLITTIPTCNSARFLRKTLESLAAQTLSPDRVIVLDDGSRDETEQVVRSFTGLACEFVKNPSDFGLFQNFNRCLDLAPETEFLHILHADDIIKPQFYEVMTGLLREGVEKSLEAGDGTGRAIGWCLDERMDEHDQHLNFSGKPDGRVEHLGRDEFLRRKAEIGNQAFCSTLLRTNYKPVPCRFPLDYPILGDMVFWAAFGAECCSRIHVRRALACYRWHGNNETLVRAPTIQSLIFDEWRTMQVNEALRERGGGWLRSMKLKGLMAVRSGIKAKRVRQNGNMEYSREIVRAARGLVGLPLWLCGLLLVEARDICLFAILGRKRHSKNIYG